MDKNPWREAINEALIANCVDIVGPDESPEAALARLVRIEIDMALDPAISSRAANMIENAKREEREKLQPTNPATREMSTRGQSITEQLDEIAREFARTTPSADGEARLPLQNWSHRDMSLHTAGAINRTATEVMMRAERALRPRSMDPDFDTLNLRVDRQIAEFLAREQEPFVIRRPGYFDVVMSSGPLTEQTRSRVRRAQINPEVRMWTNELHDAQTQQVQTQADPAEPLGVGADQSHAADAARYVPDRLTAAEPQRSDGADAGPGEPAGHANPGGNVQHNRGASAHGRWRYARRSDD